MVARLLWEQDAVGSSPVTPTTEKGHEAPSPSVTFFFNTSICYDSFITDACIKLLFLSNTYIWEFSSVGRAPDC